VSHSTLLAPLLALLACQASSAQEVRAAGAAATTQTRSVAILVYEGVELLDFAGPGEVFSAAHGPSGRAFKVFTVAKTKAPVRSQGFVTITPEFSIADCPAPDIVVIPGGNVPAEDRELQEWVQSCADTNELVMSVCNGAFLSAEAGLLDGLEVTTHHGSLQALSANFPKTKVFTNRRFVDSGHIMTCAGVSAGIDGALHVVERLLGAQAAKDTARYMEYDWRPEEIAKQHAEPGRTVTQGIGAKLGETALKKGAPAALAEYRALADRPGEGELNQEGYLLLAGKKDREARAVFELVVAAFPESVDALDSLSEACERLGDAPAAIRHAEAALLKLKTAASIEPERVRRIENCSASRLVRLGKGDPKTLRFACGPCGGDCDALRFVAGGPCPSCRMEMIALKTEE
jgi:putative intracellular protease/amidase